MVMSDHNSGFTWGDSVPDKVQDCLVRFVLNIFIAGGYGCPKIILSDNGGEVTNKLIDGISFLFTISTKLNFFFKQNFINTSKSRVYKDVRTTLKLVDKSNVKTKQLKNRYKILIITKIIFNLYSLFYF